MFKLQNLVKITAVEMMMFGSLALTAQAVEPTIDNSASASSPILIAQSYGENSSYQYEAQGDEVFALGEEAYGYGDYEQAYNYFSDAAYYYELCYQEMKRIGDPQAQIVAQKYNEAKNSADSLSQ